MLIFFNFICNHNITYERVILTLEELPAKENHSA